MRLLLILFLYALTPLSRATEQIPDEILVDGARYQLLTRSPFEALLSRPDMNSALNARIGLKSTNNWRGYIATWEIRGNRLLLQRMISGGRPLPLSAFFIGRDSPVDAIWFSGTLLLGKGEAIRARDDQSFKPDIDRHYAYDRTLRYDSYLKIDVENGYVQARENYEPVEEPNIASTGDRQEIQHSDYGRALERFFECKSALEIVVKEKETLAARLNDCPSAVK